MAIKIRFLSDIADLLRGTKKAEEGIEDVEGSLKDVARAGDKTEKQVEQNLRQMGKDADKASDKIKTGFKEAGEEAGQSGREAAASFSGGLEDVADFAQETLANALGGFGPAGAAAGVALAAGIGAALQGLADQQERLAEIRDAAADLASTLYQNQGTLPLEDAIDNLFTTLTRERKASGIEGLIDQWADFGTVLDSVKRTATVTHTPVRNLVRALSGTDISESRRQLAAVTDQLDDLLTKIRTASPGDALKMQDSINALLSVQTELKNVVGTADLARETMGAVGSSFDSAAYVAKVESVGQAWQNAATDAGDYITEQDGITTFDWSAYLTNAEATLQAANDYKRKIVTLQPDIASEAEDIFAQHGAQAANSYIDAYIGADAANKGRFEAAAKANNADVGKAAGEAMAASAEAAARSKFTGMTFPPVVVKASVDDTAVRQYVPPRKQAYIDYKARQVV